jgi:hypothetical protein
MPDSTLAGIITATSTVLTALGLVITAIAGLIRSRRIEGKVDTVHTIVNQQRTDAANYQRALINALQVAGVEVPADQSVEP